MGSLETKAASPGSSSSSSSSSPEQPDASAAKIGAVSVSSSSDSLQQQLSLLVCIRCLRTAQLAPPPIVVPFYQHSCSLEASTIVWLGSWYSALAAICEMPSGVASDVLGRKTTLQLAFVCMGACWLVTYGSSLWVSQQPSAVVLVGLGLAQLLRALGSSLYSGTDMALLFELLHKHRKQQQHKQQGSTPKETRDDYLALKLESRQVVLSTATEALVAALGGLLSRSYGASMVIWMSALPPMAGALCCFGLEETANTTDDEGTATKKGAAAACNNNGTEQTSATSDQPPIPPPTKLEKRRSSRIMTTLNEPSLHLIFGVGVVLNCGTYVAATALNPLLWQQVGISDFSGGFLQATNSGMTAVGALLAPSLKKRCSRTSHGGDDGTHGLLLLLLATSALAYGLMTWNAFAVPPLVAHHDQNVTLAPWIRTVSTVGASWLLSLVRGLAWPVLGSALNAAIGDNGTRATVLSLFAGAIKIGMVLTGFALGSILHTSASLGKACAFCTVVLLLAVVGCGAWLGGTTRFLSSGGAKEVEGNGEGKKDR